MNFQTITDLPINVQTEIARIQAISSAQRTTQEAAYLTARLAYLTNEIIKRDSENLVLIAAGNTLPTSDTGFKKGALFIKKNASGGGLYQNTGDESSATWVLIADTDTDVNNIPSGTPVNAVAASKLLTVSGLPTEDHTITVGGVVYTFKDTISAAVAAAGVLTANDVPANGNTVVVDGLTFTFVTALTEAKAVSTLTLSANMTDGNSITIGSTVYTFKETPASANDVLIGATASDTLDNLIAAINGAAGEGTLYGTGTVANTDVVAVAGAGDTMDITALSVGTAGNSIATTELSGVASWTSTTMAGGVDAVANEVLVEVSSSDALDNLIAAMMGTAGEGTKYSTGTVQLSTTSAAAGAGDTVDLTALTAGDAGNSITTVATGNLSFGSGTLTGGEGAESANDVLIGASAEDTIDNLVAAITYDDGDGTNEGTLYGTGTVANPYVTAVKASASTMTATALVAGIAGNSLAIAENDDNLSWANDDTELSGGVDGTVGEFGQRYLDTDYLYLAIAENTIADANWRRISVGAVY